MKRHILIIMWALILPLLAVAQTPGYDPQNPPDPTWGDAAKKYMLTCEAIPAANVWFSGGANQEHSAGQTFTVSTGGYDEFVFKCWKDAQGNVLSNETSFQYTMPAQDVTIYAVYDFLPGSPSDPVLINQYTLTLVSDPLVAGSFSGNAVRKVDEGSIETIYAYPNSGFRFVNWTDEKGNVLGTETTLKYLMPSHSSTLTAHFEYDPAQPDNPGTNLWDAENGELIIDFFETGRLSTQLSNMVGSSNYSQVTSVIVEGIMNDNDLSSLTSSLSNLIYVDLSRVTGLTAISGSRFTRLAALEEVELPATVTDIRSNAFNGCTKLGIVDCYALVPPSVGNNAFKDVDANMTVFVPDQSVDLYKAADGWKDFNIEPLTLKICMLEINLPADAVDGRYKDLALEVYNVKSGQKYKYVLTDRVNYTFPNLVKRTKLKAVIKNARGQIAAESDVIFIGNGAFIDADGVQKQRYNFTEVKAPQTLTAKARAITVDGNNVTNTDVTDDVTIFWFDENMQYLAKGKELEGQLPGEKVYYSVELPEALGRLFKEPQTTVYTILSKDNVIDIELMEHPTALWNRSWEAKSAAGLPIWPVTYTFTQKLNGKYAAVSNLTLDKQPAGTVPFRYFSGLEVEMTVSADGFIPMTYTFMPDAFPTDIVLTPATGPIATINFTWQEAVKAGENAEVQNFYPDHQNVSYTIFNVTKNQAVTTFTNKYPRLSLPEGNDIGDEIRITVSSTTGAFNDVTLTAKVATDNTLAYTFPLVERGGFRASFVTTENTSVVGLLFDAAGTLIHRQVYANFRPDALDSQDTNDFTVSELEDGQYTLITMGQSEFFSSIFDLSKFDAAGLVAGTDYVKNTFTVTAGKMLTVINVRVPLFQEEKFYYTGANTSFTANKSNVIQGNYLTFNTRVDFANEYKEDVTEVELVYPLPVNSNFVEGSLMLGTSVAAENQFQYVDNRTWTENIDANGAKTRQATGSHELTVQMSGNWSERVRFCIVPLMRGNYTPTAYVRFKYKGETIMQPIGSPAYTVNDVTIWTPSYISTPALHVDGNAPALSMVRVYDRSSCIGTTQALSDGYWSLEADLGYCTNLSMHEIRAEIETREGYLLNSERRFVEYNEKSIQAKDVEMNFYNGRTIIVKFDLEHVKANMKSYPFSSQNEFVFFANLTNNDPDVVDSCVIRVFTINHEWVELPARYVEGKNWVAHGYFDVQHAPIGVRVNVFSDLSDEVDFDKTYEYYSNVVNSRGANQAPAQSNFNIDLEPVGDDQVGDAGTFFQTTKSQADMSRYDREELALAVLNGTELDSIRIYTASDGSFLVADPKDGGMVWGVTADDAAAARGTNKARMAVDITNELKDRIRILSDLASFITPYTNRTFLEAKWVQAKQNVNYWEANPPQNATEQQYQKAAIALEEALRYAVINVGQITQIGRDLNTLLSYARYGIQDIADWQSLADSFQPCKGNEANDAGALAYYWRSHNLKARHGQQYITAVNMACGAAQVLLASLGEFSTGWYTTLSQAGINLEMLFNYYHTLSAVIMDFSTNTYLANKSASRNHMNWSKRRRNELRCSYAEVAVEEKKWDFTLPYPIVEPIIDPAGFVYEGVASNRLEGVTATAYYKNTYEDKWGDLQEEIVKWDAENYGQENPLFTDEKGMYQWDVPQGLWQVKFEKEGYVTAYSEWLPVPPPQMEVNIGMVQNAQPEVVKARAFEKGTTTPAAVEIEFSKYMLPDMLNETTIFIKGKNANGSYTDALQNLTFTFPDLEETIEGSGVQYAKKVLVSLPEGQNLAQYAGGVNITVSSTVLSYANIPMTETYSQDIDAEKRIEAIQAEPLLQIGFEDKTTLKVAALPTNAVAGRTVKVLVKSASTDIATLTNAGAESVELTFDANGQAEVQVNGALFGTTALQMQIVGDAAVTAETMVQVLDPAMLAEVKLPTASRANGSSVYRGESVTLSCETEGATIYYTTDGTCPCNSATRKVYKNPIAINNAMTLKVMAVGVKGTETDVVEYTYSIRQTNMTLALASEWNWTSHNQQEALLVSNLQSVALRVQTQTQEAIYDSNFGFVGNLTSFDATTGVKVNTSAAATVSLSGDEFNPKNGVVNLYTGWNWIGYPLGDDMALNDALVYLAAEEGDRIIGFANDGQAEFSNGQWKGTLQKFVAGHSYQYKSMSDKAFIYNTVATVNARALFGHSMEPAAPWSLNPHHYSSVMAVTADLVVNGLVADADEYIVGAFVADECRGIGKYVDGQLYLSIFGDNSGEELTFVAVNAVTGQQETLNTLETVTFQPDVLGSLKAPFQLFIGNPTGISTIDTDADSDNWYNLKGQRISQPAGKGLFIHGSQKVVRK